MTRPHCNLSRATAAALVAPIEARNRQDIPSTTPSVCGKLGAVLAVNKEPGSDIDPTDTTAQTMPHQDTGDSVTDDAVCEAFEAEAVFQRPTAGDQTGERLEEEFLDGEEEILDDAEDELENAMLCRAHESALKAAAAEAQKSSSENGDAGANNSVGMASEIPATGAVHKREEESVGSCVPVVLKEALKVEEPSATQQHQQQNQEGCDSPPPIVAHVGHF